MEHLWITFAFLTASIMATLALFDKIVLDKRVLSPATTTSISAFSMFLFFIIVGFISGKPTQTSAPPTRDVMILVAILLGAIYLVYLGTYFKGLETTDVSRFIPILSSDIVLVTALGFIVFGEAFPFAVYFGILIIFIGALLISIEDVTEQFKLSSKQALYYGSMVVASGATVNVVLKYLTGGMTMVTILFWLGVGGVLSLAVIGVYKSLRMSGNQLREYLGALLSIGTFLIFLRGGVIGTYFFTLTKALETGPVSLVVAIVKMQVFMVFFGVIVLTELTPEVLKEKMNWVTIVQKFMATSLIVMGVVIIQVYRG